MSELHNHGERIMPTENTVHSDDVCPQCGENRMDRLEIQDDDTVLCTSCGKRYMLPSFETV